MRHRGLVVAVLVTVTMALSHDSTQPTSLASTGFWGPDEGLGDVCLKLKFVLIFFLFGVILLSLWLLT